MLKAFTFENGGRSYTCRVEEPRGSRTQAWWWFDVSEDGQRYAPFEATEDDTEATVRERVMAYYDHLLVRRAEPPAQRQHWARRTKPTPTEGATLPWRPKAEVSPRPLRLKPAHRVGRKSHL